MCVFVCVCTCARIHIKAILKKKESMNLKERKVSPWEGFEGGKKRGNDIILISNFFSLISNLISNFSH